MSVSSRAAAPSPAVGADTADFAAHAARAAAQIESVVRGKGEVVRLALIALFARGHLLLEDVPGVGKTTLALALARSLGTSFRRVQFTNDTLPADILGVSVFHPDSRAFEFRPGPIFAGIVLADEINRTSPKTQSALLEAMTERRVTIDGETRPLPEPFMVVATQNPVDHSGTFPLPESQLDRFIVRTRMGYPDPAHELEILKHDIETARTEALTVALQPDEIRAVQARTAAIHVADAVYDYMLNIVRRTREHAAVTLGVSPRGALMLKRAAQAAALIEGRAFVLPEDVQGAAAPVLAHRLLLKSRGRGGAADHDEAARVIGDIVAAEKVPV